MTSPNVTDGEATRSSLERYDATVIEPRWQARWEELGLHRTDLTDDSRPDYYLLDDVPVSLG